MKVYGERVVGIRNVEQVSQRAGAFILVHNHSQKREAIIVPALIGALRQGRQVHFMADWNFLLLPIVAFVIRCNRPIIVNRKSARPRFLNVFRPFLTSKLSVMDQARRFLNEGEPVGIFVEGTVNRDPNLLMRGLHGAAQLSLEQDLPVVPCGIRFPHHPINQQIDEKAKLELNFGSALQPKGFNSTGKNDIRAWHSEIMRSLAELSGKQWSSSSSRKKHVA
jgi:1-acyl-sn-glycerol-3-phosphate acyltransferase